MCFNTEILPSSSLFLLSVFVCKQYRDRKRIRQSAGVHNQPVKLY